MLSSAHHREPVLDLIIAWTHTQYIVNPWDETGAAERQMDGKHIMLECRLASIEEDMDMPCV